MEIIRMTQTLASDWSRRILWPGYWPLIGLLVDTPEVRLSSTPRPCLGDGMYNSICVTRCSKSEDSRMENCWWRLIRIISGTDPTFHTWSNCVSVDTSLDGPATFYKLSYCHCTCTADQSSSLLKLADGLFLELFKMFWYLCLKPSITQAELYSRGARCIGIVQRSIIIITPFILSPAARAPFRNNLWVWQC